MRLGTGVDVAAPAERVWNELIDVRAWPHWGPTVSAVRLDGGGHLIGPGSSGSVQTALGVWLPFRVEDWRDDVERAWSWRVAGVAATTHAVRPIGAHRCRVELGVPWWAPGYLPVVMLALGRIRQRAETPS